MDLSERAVGTTAIGAALGELQPVWLHRGEHFFRDTSVYSCAGAPVFDPDGACAGMLDLTGIEAPERPELKHLVGAVGAQHRERAGAGPTACAAAAAELARAARFDEQDGLLCLDRDGGVVSANPAAREMLGRPAIGSAHCSELFALAWESLFDAAGGPAVEVPLWSGLTLQVLSQLPGQAMEPRPAAPDQRRPLKDLETELIHKAVREARGNVMAAAKMLGISRATVYRKLGRRG